MKIAVIGSGGREHTLVWKISKSPRVTKIYALPGNGGISDIAECIPIKADDIAGVVNFCRQAAIDLVVIGPEAPLSKGLADTLRQHGIAAVGPSSKSARLEASKVWAKDFMTRHSIPTARHRTVRNKIDLLKAVEEFGLPVVIKLDGLYAGKGVFICNTVQEVEAAVEAVYGIVSGEKAIVEEFLNGEEASYMFFCDGVSYLPLVTSRDHKKIYDGEKGPNTGGMGSVSPAPISKKIEENIKTTVIVPLLQALKEEGLTYNGVLYAGIMIMPDESVRVLEFNARLGDPETQSILTMMDSDIMDILEPLGKNAKLPENYNIKWKQGFSCCVVMAEEGYPAQYSLGAPIPALNTFKNTKDVFVFHAGTTKQNGEYCVNGGRVLGVTALGTTLEEARTKAYSVVEAIKWGSAYYRKDIGMWG